ncbi:MAG: hypothetical protein CSA26_09480 [Desulfobacterales bacterium]|nr:MAG: hypothetical protein CSA26_09480 [Desulfobacterales bacterium]
MVSESAAYWLSLFFFCNGPEIDRIVQVVSDCWFMFSCTGIRHFYNSERLKEQSTFFDKILKRGSGRAIDT